MNLVFADAGFWIAVRNRRDVHHGRALEISQKLFQERCRLLTTTFVFAEVYAIFSRSRSLREQIVRDVWENPVVQVEQGNYEDQRNTLNLLKQNADKCYSFSDALSFVIMERLGLKRAISFDDHFKQYGKFEVID